METRQADEQRRRAPEDGKLVRKQKDKEVGRGQGAEKHRARPADEAHDGTSELSANVIDNSKKNSSSSKVSVYNNRKKNHLKGSTSTSVSTQNVPDADYWGQSSKLKDDILPSSRMVPSSAGDIATNDRPNRSAYTARHNTYYKSPYASQNPNADSVQQKPSAVPPSKSFQPSAKNSSMDASATDSAPHCPLSISKSNEIPIHEFRDKLDTERLLNRSLVLNNIPEDLLPERREQLGQAYLSLLHGGGGSALRWISPTLCLIVFSSEALCQRGIDRSKRKSEISEFPPVLMSSLPELCSNENLQGPFLILRKKLLSLIGNCIDSV